MGDLAKEIRKVLADDRKWVRDSGIRSLEEILPLIQNKRVLASQLRTALRPLVKSSNAGVRDSAKSAITLAKELSR